MVSGRGCKAKGSAAEREIVDILRSRGFEAERTPLSGALSWMPGDVTGIEGFHLEVKRRESLRIPAWVEQAESEAGDLVPLTIYRKSHEPWRVVLKFDDLLNLIPAPVEPHGKAEVNQVFQHWQQVMHKERSTLSPERKRAIEKALKVIGVEGCLQAIDGCSKSEWHMGGNPTGTVYNDLTLIFRDAVHWERFIGEASPTIDEADRELEQLCLQQ